MKRISGSSLCSIPTLRTHCGKVSIGTCIATFSTLLGTFGATSAFAGAPEFFKGDGTFPTSASDALNKFKKSLPGGKNIVLKKEGGKVTVKNCSAYLEKWQDWYREGNSEGSSQSSKGLSKYELEKIADLCYAYKFAGQVKDFQKSYIEKEITSDFFDKLPTCSSLISYGDGEDPQSSCRFQMALGLPLFAEEFYVKHKRSNKSDASQMKFEFQSSGASAADELNRLQFQVLFRGDVDADGQEDIAILFVDKRTEPFSSQFMVFTQDEHSQILRQIVSEGEIWDSADASNYYVPKTELKEHEFVAPFVRKIQALKGCNKQDFATAHSEFQKLFTQKKYALAESLGAWILTDKCAISKEVNGEQLLWFWSDVLLAAYKGNRSETCFLYGRALEDNYGLEKYKGKKVYSALNFNLKQCEKQ